MRRDGNKILFATMNIGASSEEEYGDYFAWGETSKRYTSISGETIIGGTFEDSNAPYWNGSAYTKYNDTDSKAILEAADDVAVVLWGGNWRMPDSDDLNYLLDSHYCSTEWITNYNSLGVAGFLITGTGDYAGNSIFLPAAGIGMSNSIDTGGGGGYWSRSKIISDISTAKYLSIDRFGSFVGDTPRLYGQSVRPVLVIPE